MENNNLLLGLKEIYDILVLTVENTSKVEQFYGIEQNRA